jgi:hypothetical protein
MASRRKLERMALALHDGASEGLSGAPREIREHLAQWAVHPCERLLPGQDVRRTRLDQSRAMPQPGDTRRAISPAWGAFGALEPRSRPSCVPARS